MIRSRYNGRRPPSGSQVERDRFNALVDRWLERELGNLFDLKIRGAGRRSNLMAWSVLVSVILAVALHLLVQVIAGAGLSSGSLPSLAFLSALRFLLILGICSLLALTMAGEFLADIFELADTTVAWRFIRNAAFGGAREVLHLGDGKIAEADRECTILLVGGPGRVVVDHETAALFERPDGTPHVIGPGERLDQEPADAEQVLDGFERLRAPIISLRDQYIGSLAGEPITVEGRTLDGMPVTVTDVRGVYSVRRETSEEDGGASLENPFPFRARDIEALLYSETVEVLNDDSHPSGTPADWSDVMQRLIRSSLREFMSQNRLAEFLVGIGTQETEIHEFREDTVLSRAITVAGESMQTGAADSATRPRFRARTELSNRFKKYGSEFSTRAQEHGLELHWIGVGTWKMPNEELRSALDDKHLEAWKMNRENAQRAEDASLERVAEQALLEAKLGLIRETPLQSHDRNRARYSEKGVLTESLLQNFWEQMGEALDQMYRDGRRSEEVSELEQAMLSIEELLGIDQVGHVLGGGFTSRVRRRGTREAALDTPPAPASRAEAQKYQGLLTRLDGDYRVAEAMIANEARRHGELSREELIARILQRFERHGR